MNTSKLVKTCNTTRKIVKVLRVFSYIAIALFVFVAVVSAMPIFETIVIENDVTGAEMKMDDIMIMGSYAVSALIIGSMVMFQCEKVLGTVNTDKTPFVPQNVKRIKTISILMAVASAVPSWVSQIVGFIAGKREMMMEVELTMLVIALVIWCLALIFEYGVSLQEHEDETL